MQRTTGMQCALCSVDAIVIQNWESSWHKPSIIATCLDTDHLSWEGYTKGYIKKRFRSFALRHESSAQIVINTYGRSLVKGSSSHPQTVSIQGCRILVPPLNYKDGFRADLFCEFIRCIAVKQVCRRTSDLLTWLLLVLCHLCQQRR